MRKEKKLGILAAVIALALGGATVSQAAVDSVTGDTYTILATIDGNAVSLSAKTGAVSSSNKGLVTGQTVSAYLHTQQMALGYGTTADGEAATAYGFSDEASGDGSTAVGFYNRATAEYATAVGFYNTASGTQYATAMGSYNTASGNYSTALGLSNVASEEQASAIGAFNTASGVGASAVGLHNTVSGKASAGVGYNNTVSGDSTYVYGASNTVSAKNAFVLGSNITTVADNSVVIGDGSTSEKENTVSVGTTGGERKIVHVKDGEENTDAATFGQIAKNETYTVSHGSVTIKTNADGDAFTISGLAATDADIGDTKKLVDAGLGDSVVDSVLSVNDKVGSLSNDINKVGAGAAALAALHPEGFDPADKWSFAVGYGHYKNANAGALGAFYKPNFDTTLSIGGTIGNGSSMMNAGVSFKLGQRGARLSQNASNSQLVQEVNALRAENASQAQQIASQAKEIQELKAQMAKVLAKVGD